MKESLNIDGVEEGAARRPLSDADSLNSSDRILLTALYHFSIDGRRTTVSLRKLSSHVGRTVSSVGKSLHGLESKGVISIQRGAQLHLASTYHLLKKPVKDETGRQLVMDGLPDCFRTRDLVGPGWLHTLAPKEVPLDIPAIAEFSSSQTRPTIRKYLQVLADLAVPLVTPEQDPSDKRRKRYTFHRLTDRIARVISDDLDSRLPGWRLKPRARQEDLYRSQTADNIRRLGLPSYDDLAPVVLANVLVNGGTDCWLWQGQVNEDGYAVAHPSLANVGAHRITYRHFYGEIANGSEIHHYLDSCPRHCVNPDHLMAVGKPFHRVVTGGAATRRRRTLRQDTVLGE